MVRPVAFEGADPEEDLVPFGLEEDGGWRRVMSGDGAAGGDGYRGDVAGAFLAGRRGGGGGVGVDADAAPVPIADRTGALWDFANTLVARGVVVDCKSYAACFRVNRRQQRRGGEGEGGWGGEGSMDEEFDALAKTDVTSLGLGSSINLGCIDFYPIQSGKKNW